MLINNLKLNALFLGFLSMSGIVGLVPECAFASVQRAQIYEAKLDPSLKSMGQIQGGSLQVDRLRDELSLILYAKKTCSSGELCTAEVPIAMERVLPILSETRDSCGVITLKAGQEKSVADGGVQTLVVRDFSKRVCKMNAPVSTEILYHTHSDAGSCDSTFKAFALNSRESP